MKVGFIGLGAMGSRMAKRLDTHGMTVSPWNRSKVAGFTLSRSPREAVRGARFVVTMVSDARALRAVAKGRSGILAGLERGAVWVDMSTAGQPIALDLAREAKARGAYFVDAPVSGTLGPAERGELVAFVGGDARRAGPILRVLCKRVIRAGAVGQGQALKVVVNGLGAHHLVAFATMLGVATHAGLSRRVAIEAFTTGAFASPSYVGKKKKVLSRRYAPEFTLALTQKDAGLAVAMARAVGVDVPVLRRVTREIQRGVEAGLGSRDLFALETIYR
jgi:3-hydroxyisobutyrate dehydrogenase-like beta-hydroxyacid dehydrogenase